MYISHSSLLANARFSGLWKNFWSAFSTFFAYNEICLFLLEHFFSTPIFKSKLLWEILPALWVYSPCYVLSFLCLGLISSTSMDKSCPATQPTPVHFNLDPFNSTKSVSWPCTLYFWSVPLCSPLQCPILLHLSGIFCSTWAWRLRLRHLARWERSFCFRYSVRAIGLWA